MPAQYGRSDSFRAQPFESSVDSSSYHSTLYGLSEQPAARVPLVARAALVSGTPSYFGNII
jgi:hypothetical protein